MNEMTQQKEPNQFFIDPITSFQETIITDNIKKINLTTLKDEELIIIDVRKEERFNDDAIENAINIDWYQAEAEEGKYIEIIKKLLPNKDATYILYCGIGQRSQWMLDAMKRLGYENLINGIDGETVRAFLKELNSL